MEGENEERGGGEEGGVVRLSFVRFGSVFVVWFVLLACSSSLLFVLLIAHFLLAPRPTLAPSVLISILPFLSLTYISIPYLST